MRRTSTIEWIDTAKGACMVSVVLLHVSLWARDRIPGQVSWWYELSTLLAPLRMPLFFLLSGLLAASAVGRGLRRTRTRTLGLLWVYLLWTALFTARLTVSGEAASLTSTEVLVGLLLPTSFWYLWALPAYFLLTVAASRLLGDRVRWVLVPAAVLALAAEPIRLLTADWTSDPLDAVKLGAAAANLVWFQIGALTGVAVAARHVRRRRTGLVAAWVLLYLAAAIGIRQVGLETVVEPLVSVLGLVAAALVLGRVDHGGRIAGSLAWVGRQTLPVYVGHIVAVSLWSGVAAATGLTDGLAGLPVVVTSVLVPALAAVIVVGTRWSGAHVVRTPVLRWLLVAPRALTGASPRTAEPPPPTGAAPASVAGETPLTHRPSTS